ncbi:hypothetical protein [Psychrobium sp. 1_MG-2023]|uniref:hypothetical protein n=1 Tax=Psychrobium sp. 1_MG-2023 TaxID=3062624 RepID=UPI00129200EA|nr:hypothetical protein [Psychrobium sp. 1_MG-2023]MDP2560319.1 hypothetical protein [Psychrobium sp. 1_MG-2023]
MNLKLRISAAELAKCSLEVTRVNDSQISGFHARFGKTNSDGYRLISYYFYYRLGGRNGRQVNYFIGNSSTMDVGTARRIAMQIEPLVKQGKDIVQMKFEAEKQTVKLKTFWRFKGADFIMKKYKNSQDAKRNFEVDILPKIGSVELSKISQRLVEVRVLKPLVSAGKKSQAKVILSQLKALLSFAVDQQYLTHQPIKKVDPSFFGSTDLSNSDLNSREPRDGDAILSGAQLKGIYFRASKATRRSAFLFTLRLQILTGQSLSTICQSYRQDIKANRWLLRGSDGKLTGKSIPVTGPLKALLKEVVTEFTNRESLYLFPGKGARAKQDRNMDSRALAKAQQRFIFDVHQERVSMTQLLSDIKHAMITLKINPLVIAYLFHDNLSGYLAIESDCPSIAVGLEQWYGG